MSISPEWLAIEDVLEMHTEIINTSGGSHGLRSRDILESALSRPQNVCIYEKSSIFDLAASYAEAIAHNHPFIDGNKRTAFAAAGIFLEINGHELVVGQYTELMVSIAERKISRNEVAEYLQSHSYHLIF